MCFQQRRTYSFTIRLFVWYAYRSRCFRGKIVGGSSRRARSQSKYTCRCQQWIGGSSNCWTCATIYRNEQTGRQEDTLVWRSHWELKKFKEIYGHCDLSNSSNECKSLASLSANTKSAFNRKTHNFGCLMYEIWYFIVLLKEVTPYLNALPVCKNQYNDILKLYSLQQHCFWFCLLSTTLYFINSFKQHAPSKHVGHI